ncbi:MAG: zinc ribbon domain-containing protein [Alistipes timonensis]|nr:zinc ribbon domain-containing protein [Alistipes timonensis]
MFINLIISFIVVLGLLIFGYRHLLAKYSKNDSTSAKAVIGLPMLQLGIWAMAFIPMWAFLPTHPKNDGGEALFRSDLANWALFRDLFNQGDNLYYTVYMLGIGFLVFGGIAALLIYSLTANKILSRSATKTLCTINTVFSAIAAWNMLGTPLVPIVGGLFSWIDSTNVMMVLFIITGVILMIWIIRKAIKLQKNFNKNLATFDGNSLQSNTTTSESTKTCPYCGETILAVAKKCKHCGEWINDEDIVVEVKQIPCPICGEMIDETETICPYCNEKVEKPAPAPRNAFSEKVAAEKSAAQKNNGGTGKTWIWVLVGAVVIAIICVFIFSSNKSGSTGSSDNAYANDSMVVVEETPIEAFEEVNDYDVSTVAPTDGMPDDDYQNLDHSAQGTYTEDEVSPSDFY